MFDQKNFNYRNFIDHVMEKMRLTDTPEPTKSKIEKQIARRLGDRIITTTMHTMTEENMAMFEQIKRDNPDLSDFEALYSMIEEVPALAEAVMKGINDLADELTYDADRLDIALEKRKKKAKKS